MPRAPRNRQIAETAGRFVHTYNRAGISGYLSGSSGSFAHTYNDAELSKPLPVLDETAGSFVHTYNDASFVWNVPSTAGSFVHTYNDAALSKPLPVLDAAAGSFTHTYNDTSFAWVFPETSGSFAHTYNGATLSKPISPLVETAGSFVHTYYDIALVVGELVADPGDFEYTENDADLSWQPYHDGGDYLTATEIAAAVGRRNARTQKESKEAHGQRKRFDDSLRAFEDRERDKRLAYQKMLSGAVEPESPEIPASLPEKPSGKPSPTPIDAEAALALVEAPKARVIRLDDELQGRIQEAGKALHRARMEIEMGFQRRAAQERDEEEALFLLLAS